MLSAELALSITSEPVEKQARAAAGREEFFERARGFAIYQQLYHQFGSGDMVCMWSVLLAVCVAMVASDTEDLSELFGKTKANNKMYPCGDPQPRVFEARALLNEADGNDIIIPHVTVLHRCDGAGVCNKSHQSCQPKATEDVTLVFQKFPKMHGRRPYLVSVQEVNHTQCGCFAKKDNNPK